MNASNSAAAIDPVSAGAETIRRALIDIRVGDDLREAIAEQMRNRAPIAPAERAMVEAEKIRLFSDPQWVTRYLSGNSAARSQVALINLILDLPVIPDNMPTTPRG
jgi:hypothetical protein